MSKFPVCSSYAFESETPLCQHNKIPRNIQGIFRQEKAIRLQEKAHLKTIGVCFCQLCEKSHKTFCDCLRNKESIKENNKNKQEEPIFVLEKPESERKYEEFNSIYNFAKLNLSSNKSIKKFRQSLKNFKERTTSLKPKQSFTWIMKPLRKIQLSDMDLRRKATEKDLNEEISTIIKRKSSIAKVLKQKKCPNFKNSLQESVSRFKLQDYTKSFQKSKSYFKNKSKAKEEFILSLKSSIQIKSFKQKPPEENIDNFKNESDVKLLKLPLKCKVNVKKAVVEKSSKIRVLNKSPKKLNKPINPKQKILFKEPLK